MVAGDRRGDDGSGVGEILWEFFPGGGGARCWGGEVG